LVWRMALARLIESQLFEVPAIDPVTIATMAFTLMGAAILASWLPARRLCGRIRSSPFGMSRSQCVYAPIKGERIVRGIQPGKRTQLSVR